MTVDEAHKRAERIFKTPHGNTRTLLEYSLMADVLRIVHQSSVSLATQRALAGEAIRCADEYATLNVHAEHEATARICKDVT